MILDHNGQPIRTDQLREPQTARVAQVWREFANHPARGLTPARLRAMFSQAERGDITAMQDLADDMEEADPHLAAELGKRALAIAQLDWSVEPPANASAAEKTQAKQAEEWLKSLPDFEDLLLGMMSATLKGFACHEMVWPLVDGVRLPQITFRPQRWFTVDGTFNNLLLRNPESQHQGVAPGAPFVNPAHLPRPAVNGEPLIPGAWIVHKHSTRTGYLTRSGLARVLSWPYLYKAYGWRDFAEFLEIYGLPIRVGKYPSGASDDEKRALLQAVTMLGHNGAGIMPQGMAIEFQAAAAGAQDPFLGMLNYCDAAISKAILGQTLTASEGQHGTQALGNVHNEVRMDIRDADARQVVGTLTRQLVAPVVLLNMAGADPRRLPRFVLDTGEPEDLALYADNIPKLVKSGLRVGTQFVYDKLRIPKPADGEEVLEEPAPPPAAPAVPPGQAPRPSAAAVQQLRALLSAANAAAAGQAEPPLDLVDQLVAEQVQDWQPLLGPMVQPLLASLDAALKAGTTVDQWAAALPDLVKQLDAQPMTERLARAAFSARLAGEADLDLTLPDGA